MQSHKDSSKTHFTVTTTHQPAATPTLRSSNALNPYAKNFLSSSNVNGIAEMGAAIEPVRNQQLVGNNLRPVVSGQLPPRNPPVPAPAAPMLSKIPGKATAPVPNSVPALAPFLDPTLALALAQAQAQAQAMMYTLPGMYPNIGMYLPPHMVPPPNRPELNLQAKATFAAPTTHAAPAAHATPTTHAAPAAHAAPVAHAAPAAQPTQTAQLKQGYILTREQLKEQKVTEIGEVDISDIMQEKVNNHNKDKIYRLFQPKIPTVITAKATFPDGSQRKIQRIMIGQLHLEFFQLDPHHLGRLLSFSANQPITIYGIPNPAIVTKSSNDKYLPSMLGIWISIDRQDNPNGVINLQQSMMLFDKDHVQVAWTQEERTKLLDIIVNERRGKETHLPEWAMTLESAEKLPNNTEKKLMHIKVFRYFPPINHPYPHLSTCCEPFINRWDAEYMASLFAIQQSFTLFNVNPRGLTPQDRRFMNANWHLVPPTKDDEEIETLGVNDGPSWCE